MNTWSKYAWIYVEETYDSIENSKILKTFVALQIHSPMFACVKNFFLNRSIQVKYSIFFFLFTSILQSILALRILSNSLWRGAVTWLIIYNKLIFIIDKYNL